MFVIVGWTTKDCDHSTGYMFCPGCRARQPAAEGFRKTYFTFFWIPLFPVTTHEGYYRCQGCREKFDPDANFSYDYGDHPKAKLWECRFCRTPNPSHVHRCPVCGADA
jgi:hypothetical protein